jgi:putative DNA primase/helicase
VLLTGRPFILIDNVNEKMDAGTLAAAVTADVWNDRLLGGNSEIDRPNRATWVFTGNNLSASAEIVRRGVPIRIHPHGEHPEDYAGFKKEDLKVWATENRERLIRAALTICKRWVDAGMSPGGAGRSDRLSLGRA